MTTNSNKINYSKLGFIYFLFFVLIANASFLSYKYIKFYFAGDMLDSFGCADGCDSVMMSEYALMYGIPTPIYGLAFFLALLIVFSICIYCYSQIISGRTEFKLMGFDPASIRLLLEFMLVIGCLAALGFISVLYFVLNMNCKFCMLSHLTLFTLTSVYFVSLRSNLKSLDH